MLIIFYQWIALNIFLCQRYSIWDTRIANKKSMNEKQCTPGSSGGCELSADAKVAVWLIRTFKYSIWFMQLQCSDRKGQLSNLKCTMELFLNLRAVKVHLMLYVDSISPIMAQLEHANDKRPSLWQISWQKKHMCDQWWQQQLRSIKCPSKSCQWVGMQTTRAHEQAHLNGMQPSLMS